MFNSAAIFAETWNRPTERRGAWPGSQIFRKRNLLLK